MAHPSHIIGFDDTPFAKTHRGDVTVVGAIFTLTRLDGVVCGKVRRDGANATQRLATLVSESRFRDHLQLIMLQGIALGGFNVVDIHCLFDETGLPVMVVCRKRPDLAAVRRALMEKVSGGKRKWNLIQKAGEPEPMAGVHVQRAGIDAETAFRVIGCTAVHSTVPEPLRTAHIIASGITRRRSRQRV
ncbi:MAG: DUF99 family protein [Methylohalobius crimeensis]